MTISGWFALFLCNYRDRAHSSRYHPSSAQLSSGFPSLSTKLLPQINFATSASLRTPRSAKEEHLSVSSARSLDPFSHSCHSIRESRGSLFLRFLRYAPGYRLFYLYIFFRETIRRFFSFFYRGYDTLYIEPPFIPLLPFSLACSGAYFRFPRVGGLTVAPCNTISRGNS